MEKGTLKEFKMGCTDLTRKVVIDEIEYARETVKQFQLLQHRKSKYVFEALNAALDAGQTNQCIADISYIDLDDKCKDIFCIFVE